MALNKISQMPIKAKLTRLWMFLPPLTNQGQAYILTNFLTACLPPTRDQTYPAQLEQPTLFLEVKTRDILSYINKSAQDSIKLSIG